MIEAKMICDSISPQGKRLATMKLRYPKFIHGEFMTHRVFSRNASSSRAVPVRKSIEEVRSDALRAGPLYWGAEQKGMQSGEELDDTSASVEWRSALTGDCGEWRTPLRAAQEVWRLAALDAAARAESLMRIGAHKSIVNRVLEPFLHINVVVTATEWMNFFGLRLDKAAQPEMRMLAEAMWREWGMSKPKALRSGEWHLPFIERHDYDMEAAFRIGEHGRTGKLAPMEELWGSLCKISVARCARVSYESFETGKRSTVEEDLKLCERLQASGHWSPFEHQATPDEAIETERESGWNVQQVLWANDAQHGNFIGWRQYRKMMTGEAVAPLPEGHR